jgi:hypothetical protein
MSDLVKKTLEAIRQKHITPTPRWQFLLKDYLVWAGAGIMLVLGSLAVPVIIHMLVTNDWDVYEYLNGSLGQFVLLTLPYFWIVCLTLFVALAYYNIRHTKSGYRFHMLYVSIGSIAVSLLFGAALYGAGLGQIIDQTLADHVPFYEQIARPRRLLWMQDDHGLLAGTVTGIVDDAHFILIDFRNKNWEVTYQAPAMYQPLPFLQDGIRIRAIGRRVDDTHFKAHMLAPFNPLLGGWMMEGDDNIPFSAPLRLQIQR